MDLIDRFRGCLLGLAVGDAVGTTVEFKSRGSFPLMTDMVGGGPFDLEPGQWTDDTKNDLDFQLPRHYKAQTVQEVRQKKGRKIFRPYTY